jgi:hypothetical protein
LRSSRSRNSCCVITVQRSFKQLPRGSRMWPEQPVADGWTPIIANRQAQLKDPPALHYPRMLGCRTSRDMVTLRAGSRPGQ